MELAEGVAPPIIAVCSRAPSLLGHASEHRDQGSNLESSGSDPDALPIPPSLCSASSQGVTAPRRHSSARCAHSTPHHDAHGAFACVRARVYAQYCCVVSILGIQLSKGVGHRHRPTDRWQIPIGAKRKVWRLARPLQKLLM